jgi:RNA-directed DNA polymerase
MKCVRKRSSCQRFNLLFWQFIKAGHIERNLFYATTQGVPLGG